MKSIEVLIAGRAYPLKVTEDEETLVRSVADEINEKVRNLQNTYLQKDRQDCLSMALLTYALDNKRQKQALGEQDAVRHVVAEIESALLQITE